MRCLTLLVVAACGSDGSTPDAKPSDARVATAVAVTCPATPAATIATSGLMDTPSSATITQGQIVKFVMSSEHNVVPGHSPSDAAIADPGTNVDFGMTKCLMFTQTGMFGFHCGPHQFNGTVIVQ